MNERTNDEKSQLNNSKNAREMLVGCFKSKIEKETKRKKNTFKIKTNLNILCFVQKQNYNKKNSNSTHNFYKHKDKFLLFILVFNF